MTARMFFGVIFCIIAIVAHAESRNCILIFEGDVNNIMVPKITTINNAVSFNNWHSRSEDNFQDVSKPAFETAEQSSNYKYSINFDSYDYISYINEMHVNSQSESNYTVAGDFKFDYTGDRICPDVSSFPLYDKIDDTYMATVSVAKPPLNTLCRPNKGKITGADSVEILGKTDSLYDCATKVVEPKDGARGVQWDIGEPGGPGVCTAFYGKELQFNSELTSSLACVLKCNWLPNIGVEGTGRTELADDETACVHLGEEAGSHSISYVWQNKTCHLYDSTEDVKLNNRDGVRCYLPPKPTTPTTTTTQKSTLSTGEKAVIGAVAGIVATAGAGAAAYTFTGGKILDILDILKDLMPSSESSATNVFNESGVVDNVFQDALGTDVGVDREQFVDAIGKDDYF